MTDSELIQNLDYDGLLVSISKGSKLNQLEIDSIHELVTSNLKSPREKRSLEDLYASLTVLDKADDPTLAYLVSLYLDFQDPLLVSYALETLVIKWGKFEDIQERIVKFGLGMPWDHDQDLRLSSLNCIEKILENCSSEDLRKQIKDLLTEIQKDENLEEDLDLRIKSLLGTF